MLYRTLRSIFHATACCAVFLGAASCSDSSTQSSACGAVEIGSDTARIIDQAKNQGKTYYLVLRVSGLNDKTEIVEVYDVLPSFDRCGKNKEAPIAGDSLETTQTVTRLSLNTKERSLDIEYKDGKPGPHDNESLKLEFK